MSDEAAEAIYYSVEQRAEIWDRWRRGKSMSSIGRRFDRESSSVFSVLSPSGGIRPAERRRSGRALSLADREKDSRGLVAWRSLRAIAAKLGRVPYTISHRPPTQREAQKNLNYQTPAEPFAKAVATTG